MRLFIAVLLSPEICEALSDVQDRLYRRGVRGNYTNTENLHLTLAFIGDYSDPHAVLEAMASVPFVPFPLALEGIGCFRDLWWAGIRKSDALETYVRRLRHALSEADIPFDKKRFSPHITLIRKAVGRLPGISIPTEEMQVVRISLMRSERGKQGMVYTEIDSVL